VQLRHSAVAGHLGQVEAAEWPPPWHRPSTTAATGTASTGTAVAVDDHAVRAQAQAFDGAPHRQHRGLQDVQSWSISSTLAWATLQHSARARISSNSRSPQAP
jgi:hypothetical protein